MGKNATTIASKICIVIPIHNEGRAIGALVEALRAKSLDVLVIDDGSTDNSGSLAREKGAVVIRHPTKQGKGRSLQRGFTYALEKNYKGVISMDGDGQHAVADIDSFLAKIQDVPDSIINGNRMRNSHNMPFIRRVTNRSMSWLISIICQQRIPDTQCGFRYIAVDILKNIQINSKDFEIETEVLVKACRKGYPVYSISVRTIYNNEESKINPLKDTIRFFVYIIRELIQRG